MPAPSRRLTRLLLASFASLTALCTAGTSGAQSADADTKAAIATADSVLVALSSNDLVTLKRLLIDSAIVGSTGVRNGGERVRIGSFSPYLSQSGPAEFTERGFGSTARVQDRVAMVWVPYDLYVGKTWSHCGVDLFTLVRSGSGWRVASLIYTIEQPPACQKHPNGPPR